MCDTNKGPLCACGDAAGSCGCDTERTRLQIDFLYLDLSVCGRCQSTESTLEKTLEEIGALLTTAGYLVVLRKIHIDSIDKAILHKFVSSPTIKVNGIDIVANTEESNCRDCGDLCGSEVDCRDWVYQGVRYTEPPKPMLINAILKEIYLPSSENSIINPYEVPENIKRFFLLR
ncbi:MAG: hypothetical protein A2Y16_05070 [Tenericutes bacterium GWF2_57_13]|nr:MAG: hypothetical protein A2Y16_05070 [Tenericutes bacterium GWF2_57_13]